jgi:UDP-N-acetylmuramate dehydrogenase
VSHDADTTLDSVGARLRAIGGLAVCENEPMGKHLSMGVGGPARWFVVAETIDALAAIVGLLRIADCGSRIGEETHGTTGTQRVEEADGAGMSNPHSAIRNPQSSIPWMMLGGGSNTVFADSGYAGVVVMLGRAFGEVKAGPRPHQVTAGAATALSKLMNFAKRQALAGLEFAGGIPGTLGGALAGNAGTAAGEICPLVESVEVLSIADRRLRTPDSIPNCQSPIVNLQSSIDMIRRGGFRYGYRWSGLRDRVIVRATLQLAPGDPRTIQQGIDAALAKRWEQPVGLRCSGCMFKNPAGDYAGRLIDQAGLKGLRVGGARVSEQHANFMINDGTATASDLTSLIALVRDRVREATGTELELEVRMVGTGSHEPYI